MLELQRNETERVENDFCLQLHESRIEISDLAEKLRVMCQQLEKTLRVRYQQLEKTQQNLQAQRR